MNYVILNGIKSTTIQGLLIQSLPPITKPLMRTSVEEIDGRDGDIVTKLGYSAYNKQMSIGLFGNYDVDEVIEYFDSEGTVIFSNEPDKFYHYEIIDQIDFEKLLRFKTATVTFHVQPFKFSAVDDAFNMTINQMTVRPYSRTANGVTVKSENGEISFKGTATAPVEFYVPIKPMTLKRQYFTIEAENEGTGESAVAFRVIVNSPTLQDTLGISDCELREDEFTAWMVYNSSVRTFNYIWFTVSSGTAMDFTLKLSVMDFDTKSCNIFNRGNIYSRPKLTIDASMSSTIKLSINGVELFTIDMGDKTEITLDGQQMNAYSGDTLMNRSVQGDYNNLKLKTGMNTLSWTGTIFNMRVEDVSRWI